MFSKQELLNEGIYANFDKPHRYYFYYDSNFINLVNNNIDMLSMISKEDKAIIRKKIEIGDAIMICEHTVIAILDTLLENKLITDK